MGRSGLPSFTGSSPKQWRLAFSLAFSLTWGESAAQGRRSCSAFELDCGYFGCFPSGSQCPLACDRFPDADSCHTIETGDGRQACLYNPQYSMGRGLCQRDVTCYDLGNGICSEDCFSCQYFGCIPAGTNCPAYCEIFGVPADCESKGGVAGGMACQWNGTSARCESVPLDMLRRTLLPSPSLAYPALTIRDGATITPSNYPSAAAAIIATAAPTPLQTATPPLDWPGARSSPGRVALFIGLAVAAIGLVCVIGLLYRRRARKVERNRNLGSGWQANEQGTASRSSFQMPPGTEKAPQTLFHSDSLIVHVRNAISKREQSTQVLSPKSQPNPSADSPSSLAVKAELEMSVAGCATAPRSPGTPVFRPLSSSLPKFSPPSSIDLSAESPLSRIATSWGRDVLSTAFAADEAGEETIPHRT